MHCRGEGVGKAAAAIRRRAEKVDTDAARAARRADAAGRGEARVVRARPSSRPAATWKSSSSSGRWPWRW